MSSKTKLYKNKNHWTLRIKADYKDHYFPLTADLKESEALALAIKNHVRSAGVVSAKEKFLKGDAPVPTVGAYLAKHEASARALELSSRTLRDYHRSVFKVFGEGCEGVRLDELSKVRLTQFKNSVNTKDLSAKCSANSVLRHLKALFSPRAVEVCGFEQLEVFDAIRSESLFRKAKKAVSAPESKVIESLLDRTNLLRDDETLMRIFLLAFFGGLRRSEILHAKKSWLENGSDCVWVGIGLDSDFTPKGQPGHAKMPLRVGRYLQEACEGDFLIGQALSEYSLNQKVKQLRSLFQDTLESKPLHALRRIYGSIIASDEGLFQAQKYLRHSSAQTTFDYYARVSVDESVIARWKTFTP